MIARAPPSRHRRVRQFEEGDTIDQSGRYPGVLLRERVLRRTCNRGRNAACLTKAEDSYPPRPLSARAGCRTYWTRFQRAINAPRRMREMIRPLFQLRMIKKSDPTPWQ